jgi:hypothetical protein
MKSQDIAVHEDYFQSVRFFFGSRFNEGRCFALWYESMNTFTEDIRFFSKFYCDFKQQVYKLNTVLYSFLYIELELPGS